MATHDLQKMRLEFPKHFEEIFENVRDRLRRDLILKFEVIKLCEMQHAHNTKTDTVGAMRSKFASVFLGEVLKEMNHRKETAIRQVS